MYLSTSKIMDDQLLDLITTLKEKTCIDYNSYDLNKLTPEEVKVHKDMMEKQFTQNAKKPTDPDFVYDMRREFNQGDEECSWDDDI